MKTQRIAPVAGASPGRRIYALAFVLGLSLLASDQALGQWSYYVGLSAAYDDNPFALYQAPASSVWTLEAGVDYAGRRLSAGYVGNYVRYDQLATFDAILNQGYLSLGSDTTSVGFLVDQRISVEEKLYDYVGLSAVIVHQFGCLGLRCTWQGGGRLFRFAELTERNQQSVLTSLRSARSFQTGTTVIATLGLGYAAYSTDFATDAQVNKRPTVWQMNGSFRLAQALTPTTGVALQYQLRVLDGETPAAYVIEEDGVSYALLDDPSLYSARTFGLELTQMMRDYALTLKAGAYHVRRNYLTQGSYINATAYDLSVPREDTYNTVWLRADYDLRLAAQDVTLQLGAQWTDNQSTSYWYTYAGSYLSLGVRYNF